MLSVRHKKSSENTIVMPFWIKIRHKDETKTKKKNNMKSDGAKIMIFFLFLKKFLFGKLKIFLWIIKFRYDDDDDDSDNQKIKGTEKDTHIRYKMNIIDFDQQKYRWIDKYFRYKTTGDYHFFFHMYIFINNICRQRIKRYEWRVPSESN